MWNKIDYVIWTWLNVLITLVIMVLAIEQFTLLVASPFAVLFYMLFGWFVIHYMLEYSDVEKKECIGECSYMVSFMFGLIIQAVLVYHLAWNQWLLTSNFYWLYAPLWVAAYWLIQITYGISMNFRCVVEE